MRRARRRRYSASIRTKPLADKNISGTKFNQEL